MTDVTAPGEGAQAGEGEAGEDRDYPLIREAVQAGERSAWGLVDALLAEARTVEGAPRGGKVDVGGRQLARGEIRRISEFLQRGDWASGHYSPNYLRMMHETGRWADGNAEVRDYPVRWAMDCRSVPVAEAVALMARNRHEPLPEGANRGTRLREMVAEHKAPASLDARRPTGTSRASQTLDRLKAAERAANNLETLARWAERADAEQLDVFIERAQATLQRLTDLAARVRAAADQAEAPAAEAPKAKRTRRAKAATTG